MANPSSAMRWASALSQRADGRQALAEVSEALLLELGGAPDLALLFVSHQHAPSYEALSGWAQTLLAPRHLLGCSGSGVIGSGREVERQEAISVVAARLPGVELFPFYMDETPRSADSAWWSELSGVKPADARGFLLWSDPFSVDTEGLLKRFDTAYPAAPKLGALVSGAQAPGEAALFLDGRVLRSGALGLGFSGRVQLETAVAQGCRPVGDPMIVTRCRDSVVYELNVGKPVEALQRLFERLDPRDQELCRHSLFIGIEMSAEGHRYAQGDFLIRTLGGMEPKRGAMAVQAHIENYQVIQFHLRDARTSAQDLDQRLLALHRAHSATRPRGALLFCCVGRGQELYGAPNHDTDLFCRHFGALPIGGMFAAGEIGPVGGRSFVHGYTSVVGVFSEPPAAS